MKINIKALITSIAIPLIIGFLSGFLSGDSRAVFDSLNQPPLSPPGWLFPIVWTILFILMGISSYLIFTSSATNLQIKSALTVYSLQLLVNFLWPIFFFKFGLYRFSFVWILLLLFVIIMTIKKFKPISKSAAYLLIPYLLWVCFAAYLNLGIILLN